MKHQTLLFLLGGLPLFAGAQSMGNYDVQQRQLNNLNYQNVVPSPQFRGVPKSAELRADNVLEISINALANERASSYVAVFNIVQVGKTAEETNSLLNNRLDGFINALKNLGFKEEDIYVDMVNFLPKYEYDVSKKLFSKKTYTEIPKGFELQKNVHIRYTKPALLDKVVTAAAQQEIFDIVKVDYFIDDPNKVYKQLREATFAYLNDIKTRYRSIGTKLDSAYLSTAENAWVAYPANRYESYQAFCTQNLDAGEKNNAVINTADKPVSRFYNAIPANDYDIVINPEILEPCIQFSYNLIARFTLPERKAATKTELKKEFILVTPAGEVKTLKVE